MSEPFAECWERLHRANFHRRAITDLWDSLRPEDLYEVIVEVNSNGNGLVRLHPKGFPFIIALQLGEILYQLRAALDNAVHTAVVLQTGQNPPPDEDKLEFPICRTRDEFDGYKAQRKLGPLVQGRKAIIESVQSYHGSALAETIQRINEWARKDRHRRLHLVGCWASRASIEFDLPPERIECLTVVENGFLEDDPKIADFKLSGVPPGTKFDVDTRLSTDIAVKDVPPTEAQEHLASDDRSGF